MNFQNFNVCAGGPFTHSTVVTVIPDAPSHLSDDQMDMWKNTVNVYVHKHLSTLSENDSYQNSTKVIHIPHNLDNFDETDETYDCTTYCLLYKPVNDGGTYDDIAKYLHDYQIPHHYTAFVTTDPLRLIEQYHASSLDPISDACHSIVVLALAMCMFVVMLYVAGQWSVPTEA